MIMASSKTTNINGTPPYKNRHKIISCIQWADKELKKYKTKFSSFGTIYGIFYSIRKHHLIPDLSETAYIQENNDNIFIYSVIEYSLEKSADITRIKRYFKPKGGTSSWKELMSWYEGKGSTEILA